MLSIPSEGASQQVLWKVWLKRSKGTYPALELYIVEVRVCVPTVEDVP